MARLKVRRALGVGGGGCNVSLCYPPNRDIEAD